MNDNYKPNQDLTLGAVGAVLSLNKEFQETSGDHINGLANVSGNAFLDPYVFWDERANSTAINDSVYVPATTGGSYFSQTLTIPNINPSTTTVISNSNNIWKKAVNNSNNIWKEETEEDILDKKLRPYISAELTKLQNKAESLFDKIQKAENPLDKQNYIQSFQYVSGFSKALEEVLNIINDPS